MWTRGALYVQYFYDVDTYLLSQCKATFLAQRTADQYMKVEVEKYTARSLMPNSYSVLIRL